MSIILTGEILLKMRPILVLTQKFYLSAALNVTTFLDEKIQAICSVLNKKIPPLYSF